MKKTIVVVLIKNVKSTKIQTQKRIQLLLLAIFSLLCFAGCKKEPTTFVLANETLNVLDVSEVSSACFEYNSDRLFEVLEIKKGDKDPIIYGMDREAGDVFWFSGSVENRESIVSVFDNTKTINAVCMTDDWLVWEEDNDRIHTGDSTGEDWAIYAFNYHSREISLVDSDKKLTVDASAIIQYSAPRKLSVSENKLVYSVYEMVGNKVCATIKMVDLFTRESKILDYKENYTNGFYSYPNISGNKVVWSWSDCDHENLLESGYTYVYDLAKGNCTKISSSGDILWPAIEEDTVVARVKPDGQNDNSYIVGINLDAEKPEWRTLVPADPELFSGREHIEMTDASIHGGNVTFDDNYRKSAFIYNIEKNSLISIPINYPERKGDWLYANENYICWYYVTDSGFQIIVEEIEKNPDTVENSVDANNESIVGNGVDLKFFAANGCTYYIDRDGQLLGWGRNFDGSLGFSEDILIEKPTEIPIPEKVVDLSPGVFSVALSENGNIYSWGVVSFGSEGSERIIDTTPEKVSMPEKIVRIFNGHGSVGLAQGESGITYIWGWNLQGLLANGNTAHSFEPIALDISSRVLEISCYDTHVIALCEDGKVYTWGSNYYGELGDNSEIDISQGLVERNRLKPDVVNLDEPIISVAAGRGVSYALSEDGNLYAWGANDVGQLGIGKDVTYSSSPMKIPFDSKIKAVIAGAFHTYALTEDGELWGWGYNSRDYEDMSVLGIGSYERIVYVPTQIIIEENVEYITTGTVHTFVATQDGSILSWGENGTKAVSFETNKNVDTPIMWKCGD